MQFQVPQFIDVEDRIFGPLTLRQFLFLAGAGAVSFFCFFLFTTKVWIGVSVLFFGIAASLAFIKINGQSMPAMVGYVFHYLWKPKFYVWRYNAASLNAQPIIHDLPTQTNATSPLQSLLLRLHGGAAKPPTGPRQSS